MSTHSRRAFIGSALAAGALIAACGESKKKKGTTAEVPVLHDRAPDGPPLKAGLVGCGGRGTGAALDFIDASPNCEIVALGDVFRDRIDSCREKLKKERDRTVPDENCFVGFDAYRRVLDSGIDVMTAGQARTKNLTVISGTCWRHHKKVIETYRRVVEGAIGEILAARAYFNTGQLWYRERQKGWSDMEWMIRDWVNWCWLSGDHIVEQHVHNLDTMSLFIGDTPVKAVGFGARHRRVTGDQYDCFAVDFEYENGLHLSSMCRQIDGCANNVSDFIVGSEGSTDCRGTIYNPDGSIKWKMIELEEGQEKERKPYEVTYVDKVRSMYKQEHIDLVTSIRTGEGRNEVVATAKSTLMGVMGRMSAYTGKEVTWQEMMDSELRLGPTEYEMGPVDMEVVIPVPGKAEG